MEDGFLVSVNSVADDEQNVPIGTVRGRILQAGWLIQPLSEKEDACTVTYIVQVDPAGWIPKFVVNMINDKEPLIIKKVETLLTKEYEKFKKREMQSSN